MIISIHQPAYIPWMPYFERIRQSDLHIFLDHVQFEKGSYINRQKINDSWMTIPLRKPLLRPIIDMEIDGDHWIDKHEKTIIQNFKTDFCLYFYLGYQKLADMLYAQLKYFLKKLKIDTEVIRSSTIENKGDKSDLVLNLCKRFRADKYISGPINDYLNWDKFDSSGVQVVVDRSIGLPVLHYV